MSENKPTTVQISIETRNLLKQLAIKGKRSMTAELSWLVEQEVVRQQGGAVVVESAATSGLGVGQ